jgi:hypothetical protein
MSVIIQGVFTNVGREAMAKSILGPLVRPPYAESYFKYFKIGTGGYILGPGGGKIAKTPDPARTDLESVLNPSMFTFQKDFVANDLTYFLDLDVPFAIAKCFLEFGEANDDGFGQSPEFFEIGIFDANDVMLVYATFPGETKNGAKTLNHIIKCNF